MSQPDASDVQAAFCAVLVDEWVRAGVTDAVIAPGSRSTPLVLALDADRRLRVHVVLDERSAGFVALGVGLATGRPAVVVTTSGTASVEIHPAVVEAHQAGVALIAATSDRPPELHHVGAPQTVEQEDLFGGCLRWKVTPGVAELSAATSWRSVASRVVAEACSGPAGPGPVHINLAFREPLIGSPDRVEVPAGRAGGLPWHSVERGATGASAVPLLQEFAGGRGLLVAGSGASSSLEGAQAILASAEVLGWPVFADPRSGCRLPHDSVVAAADSLLRIPEVADWRPDLVVSIGAPWASKVLNQWLAGLRESTHVLVDPWGRWADPDRRAERVIAGDAASVLSALVPPPDLGPWSLRWQAAESAAQSVFDAQLGHSAPLALSEPAVARSVIEALPAGSRVVVSSSMPVRDVEWFSAPRRGLTVHSNRGANGIDGVVATAIGVALHGDPTVALIGDLAFLYDAGSLLWAVGRELSLTIVVLNNNGGGIFSFLPQASTLAPERFEAYWGTPHGVDLAAVASAYGASVAVIEDRSDLQVLLESAAKPGVRVAVVASDRDANVAIHDQLNSGVAEAVRAAWPI